MMWLQKIGWIALGGALGALGRYGLSVLAHRWFGEGWPYGTFIANLLGALLIGILWAFAERSLLHEGVRLFLFVGLLGAFTTFSTYSLEGFMLFKNGAWRMGLGYLLASNVGGLLLVALGYWLGRGTGH